MKSSNQCLFQGQEQPTPTLFSYQEEKKQQFLQPQQFIYQDYFFQDIGSLYFCLQISPDEQTLAFGGLNKQLTILNLNIKQIVKELKCDDYVMKCRFSNDSKFIYCIDFKGQLYQFDINQDFKLINKNNNQNLDIRFINNELVLTYTKQNCILVTDIKSNQQLLKINHPHNIFLNCLEYDSGNQMIISCSDDKSIKFFQMDGNLLIDIQNAHKDDIYQIQLKNNSKSLISRTEKELKLWKIYQDSKLLKQVRKFIEKEDLQSFNFVQNDQFLIKIYEKYLLILDNNFKIIKKQQHKINCISSNYHMYYRTSIFKSTKFHELPIDQRLKINTSSQKNQLIQIKIILCSMILLCYSRGHLIIWF
ncbi:hypothetical protein pb186bvf_014171 [Paramecium bursaria]